MYASATACTKENEEHSLDLIVQSKYEDAFEFVSEKLKECPEYIELRRLRAMLFDAKKMYSEELEEVEHILKLDPLNDFF